MTPSREDSTTVVPNFISEPFPKKTGLVLKEESDDIKPRDTTTAVTQFITEEARLDEDGYQGDRAE